MGAIKHILGSLEIEDKKITVEKMIAATIVTFFYFRVSSILVFMIIFRMTISHLVMN